MPDVQPARKSTQSQSCCKKKGFTIGADATDMNEVVLRKAKAGIFPLGSMQEYTQHYLKAGGKQSFLSIALPLMTTPFFSSLKENIVF